MSGVDSFDIEGRVSLGISEFLSIFKYMGKIGPFLCHSGQDVVAGSIKDAENCSKVVGRHVSLDGGKDRNATAYGRFVQNFNLIPGCCCVYFGAMNGKKRLVGGNNMLAVFYCP